MTWLTRLIINFFAPDKLFYPGQEITMVKNGDWSEVGTNIIHPGPKFGEIVKIRAYARMVKEEWYIHLIGHYGCYQEKMFAPIISDDKLEEMLNDIDELMIKTHGTW